MHNWHGRKAGRQYQSRWEILEKWQFDPQTDLTKNVQGVYELSTKRTGLRDDIKAYFRRREEDGIEND